MKLLLCLSMLVFSMALAQTQTLAIDSKTSTLNWTGHAEFGTYAPSGTLSVREGRIVIENGSLRRANLVIDMKSLTQSNADLTHHLKSSDFFDVERFPTAELNIDRIANATIFGTMTIKGKSAPFQVPVKVTEANNRFSITGKATLDRTQYGVVYNSSKFFSNLGDKAIRNTFEVEFALSGAGQIPPKYQN